LDWTQHNAIRADRKVNSIYIELLKSAIPDIKLVEPRTRSDVRNKNGTNKRTTDGQPLDSPKNLPIGQQVDSPLTANGQLRLGQGSIGKDSLSKDKLDKDNIGKDSLNINNKIITNNGIMTEQQLLQAVYLEKIKDRNAENIIECVSYLKHLPIEIIKIALEKTSIQLNPQWSYTKELLDNWVKQGIKNISDIEEYCNLEECKSSNTIVNSNTIEQGGFKRKGDEILNGS